MNTRVTKDDLTNLYRPSKGSHKGQNGRLLIIGGSHLFHAASLWSLTVASRIVDLVHYSSVPENNQIVEKAKEEFRNGIVVRREDVESYIEEDDCILIGPGMMRSDNPQIKNSNFKIKTLEDINGIQNEGQQTAALTNYLLAKFPEKQWVIDAGALQMMDISVIPRNAILTPHHGEFDGLWKKCQMTNAKCQIEDISIEDKVKLFVKEYHCIVLLKGEKDIACSGGDCDPSQGSGQVNVCKPGECKTIEGGNAGMTKGGTGDVLAGLIAALACKNDPFLATIAGSFINKRAGDMLYKRVGPYFNASDLANQIPETMKELLLQGLEK